MRTIPTHVGRTPIARDAWRMRDGPSPRTWGEPAPDRRRRCDDRTIPTHVGRTQSRFAAALPCADHPHARGENRSTGCDSLRGMRTIPTHVGRTRSRSSEMLIERTIPTHVGRTPIDGRQHVSRYGPSPRTWGERDSCVSAAARAADHPHARGENACEHGGVDLATDHPHARGENRSRPASAARASGPSPRTWGERRRRCA